LGAFVGYHCGMATTVLTQPELLDTPPPPGIFVNARCIIYEEEGMRVVMLHGLPVFFYHRDDKVAEDTFIAQAQEAGFAQGTELASALGRCVRTAYRIRQRYLADGASGLAPKKRGPKGPRLGAAREAAIRRWKLEGRTVYWMAQRLKISRSTVRDALIRMGLPTRRVEAWQEELLASAAEQAVAIAGDALAGADSDEDRDLAVEKEPAGSVGADANVGADADGTVSVVADAEAIVDSVGLEVSTQAAERPGLLVETTLDTDPGNRAIDRTLAAVGLLDDAAPLFATAESVPRAGVLLAVPALVNSGVFAAADEVYGHIGPAFYGLRTILLTMVLLVLLRIKHPENVKEHSPGDLGRIIGLDRAPEVKTIRRKLARLAFDGEKSERFIEALVRRRAERTSDALGFLYVDGHVRVYHGKADLPKAHVARMRLSLPATQDVWVNDANGDPVFFVTQEVHPQLVSALPPVLEQVRRLAGERRVTVVFDRGGWSPKLFQSMHAGGFDVLTYRKGKVDPIPEDDFTAYAVELPTGQITYELHDASIAVGGNQFRMRQVTRRNGDHQTHIVTTRHDLPVTEVARRMFNRWRQENFFKYMRQEFAIDALIEYGTEPDDEGRLVPNPARQVVERDLRNARQELTRIEAAYAVAAVDDQERERTHIAGFEPIYGAALHTPLREARVRIQELVARRNALPSKVPVGEVKDDVVCLPVRRKRLSDALKMLAYQVESDMTRAVAPHYARSLDEGRRLIRAALQSAADIQPVAGELRITLVAQSSPHRSLALARLCQHLNETETCFPGTSLRLRYAVRGVECDT